MTKLSSLKYFRSPQEMAEVFVRNMSNDLGMNFAGRTHFPRFELLGIFPDGAVKGEIEVFVTRAGHVTDWHFDFMENFTIQLKGRFIFFLCNFYFASKTWKLMPNNVPHPMRGCTPHYKNLDTIEQQLKIHRLHDQKFEFEPKNFDNVEEVTLTPGSILYFPAGYWY